MAFALAKALESNIYLASCQGTCLTPCRNTAKIPLTLQITVTPDTKGGSILFDNTLLQLPVGYHTGRCTKEDCTKGLANRQIVGGICDFALIDLTAFLVTNGFSRVWWYVTEGRFSQKSIPKAKKYFRYWVQPDGTCTLCTTPYPEIHRQYPYSLWIADHQFDTFFAGRKVLFRKDSLIVFAKETKPQFLGHHLGFRCQWHAA